MPALTHHTSKETSQDHTYHQHDGLDQYARACTGTRREFRSAKHEKDLTLSTDEEHAFLFVCRRSSRGRLSHLVLQQLCLCDGVALGRIQRRQIHSSTVNVEITVIRSSCSNTGEQRCEKNDHRKKICDDYSVERFRRLCVPNGFWSVFHCSTLVKVWTVAAVGRMGSGDAGSRTCSRNARHARGRMQTTPKCRSDFLSAGMALWLPRGARAPLCCRQPTLFLRRPLRIAFRMLCFHSGRPLCWSEHLSLHDRWGRAQMLSRRRCLRSKPEEGSLSASVQKIQQVRSCTKWSAVRVFGHPSHIRECDVL